MGVLRSAFLLLLSVAATNAAAEQFRDFGTYRVHYNAFNSTIIAPEIAQAYGLDRSRFRGILNVTVQRKDGQSPWPAAQARVEATATNLAGRVRRIDMQEIQEGEAIYYIGEFPVTDRETMEFEIQVRPQGSNQSYPISFRQQFFID